MHFSQLFVASSMLASSALAVSHLSNSTTPSNGQGQVVHVVQVGSPNSTDLKFYPNNLKANVGDLVQFQFWPMSHSVVSSTFDQPCIPLESSAPNRTDGFFSGFMPTNRTVATGKDGIMVFTIPIKATTPIWYYCSRGRHCQNGMVGAINAPTTGAKTIEAFIGKAATASQNVTPGQAPGASNPPANNGTSPVNGGGSGGGSNGGNNGGNGSGEAPLAPTSTSGLPAQQTTNAGAASKAGTTFMALVAAGVTFLML